MKLTPTSLLTLSFLTAASGALHAAVIVVAPTAGTPGSFQITNDVTFTITTSGTARVFLLDEWVTSDGSRTFASYSPALLLSINGAAPVSFGTAIFVDNFAGVIGQITANDGYFYTANDIPVAVGDTMTLKVGTFSVAATSGFNPQATRTFIGNMFVTDVNGVKLSNTVGVPEPAAAALLLVGASAGLLRRQRRG